MTLSDEKKLLLMKAVENDGRVKMSMAKQLYSSRSTAKSAISTLEFKGYLERDVPGVFKVVKIPDSVEQRIRERQEEEQVEEEFEKEPVTP